MTPSPTPTFHVIVRAAADGAPHFEVMWRSPTRRSERGKPTLMKRRLGPAWLEGDGAGGWRKRRGRAVEGYLDERRATVAAEATVCDVEADITTEAQERRRLAAQPLTFREVAHEWLDDMRTVARVKPSTLRDYEILLREPGAEHRRGSGKSPGRIMAAFGDLDVRKITPKQVGDFLRSLDAELTPRNVNKYRQVLSVIFGYACREDTHSVAANPVLKVPKRREAASGGLDYYEAHEVEQLAQALAQGRHRKPAANLTTAEMLERAWEDARDADFVRLLFFTGMRLGEIRALQWRQVALEERAIVVTRNVSAGEVVDTPKGGRARLVPLATPAVDALRRQSARPDFTGPDDLVFGGRWGEILDDSALRRRYTAACKAAGLRRVKLHGLRHAAGSHVARQAQATEVRDFLGHSKLATTDRYVSARFSAEFLERLDAGFGHEAAEHITEQK
jgi:integrase